MSKFWGKNVKIGINEYLLLNSGIIYVICDDVLLDISVVDVIIGDINKFIAEEEMLSILDFKFDFFCCFNGICLINGINLFWIDVNDGDVVVEKGFIFVLNLFVYIKVVVEDGIFGFNFYKKLGVGIFREEFNDILEVDWSNFYICGNRGFNFGFVCCIS